MGLFIEVSLEDSLYLLTVDLEREIPEEEKPRLIEVH